MPQPIVSDVFVCGCCHSPVALVMLPGGDLVYACQNDRCQKAVSVDCPEALALLEDAAIALWTARVYEVAR